MSSHHHGHPAVHLTVHEDDVYSNTSIGVRRLTWREAYEREQEQSAHYQRLAAVLMDLDRCEHGRHEGDICSGESGCDGPSKGNPLLPDGYGFLMRLPPGTPELRQIGFSIDGRPIVVPPTSQQSDPDAWRMSIPSGLRDELRDELREASR